MYQIIDFDELIANNFDDIATEHKNIANIQRESNYIKNMLQFSPNRVEDKRYFDRGNMIPIIFEETVIRPTPSQLEELDRTMSTKSSMSTSHTHESGLHPSKQNSSTVSKKKGPSLTAAAKAHLLASIPDPLSSTTHLSQSLIPFLQLSSFTPFGSYVPAPNPYSTKPLQLVVLCHGLQGTHADMVKTKHYISLINWDAEIVCSRANEDQTTKDISELGINLANEVRRLVSDLTKNRKFQSISFVGHSLGGLIIRAALPHLEIYKDYFKSFMTLSTPHLGVGAGDSKLVETGFSLLTSWAKHLSLEQMGMKDASDPYNSLMYRLSTKPGLDWFQEVILISSPQDTYSPFDSSRVQVSTKNSSNLKNATAYADMVDNILGKIKCNRLRRVDVCLKFQKSNLDTFIGRAAHIAMINDGILLEMLSYRYGHLL